MKVYVITQGCYSDYHICAVTLDKDKAERLQKLYSAKEGSYMITAEIEEYEADDTGRDFTEEEKNSELFSYYHVQIIYGMKEREASIHIDKNVGYCFNDKGVVCEEKMYDRYYYSRHIEIVYEIDVRTDRNTDEVKKIAEDRFYKMLAERYGL